MASRLQLQNKLEEIFESKNVYYQPPPSMALSYPAIVYSRDKIVKKSANNVAYLINNSYKITVIDSYPDNNHIIELLKLPECSYDRQYVTDGLYHDVLLLYY